MEVPDKMQRRILWIIIWGIIGLGAVWLFIRFLYRPLLPFLVAWLVAACLQPAIRWLTKKTKASRKFIGVTLVLLVTTVLVLLVIALFNGVIGRSRSLLEWLSTNADNIGAWFNSYTDRLRDMLSSFSLFRNASDGSVLSEILETFDNMFSDILGNATQALSAKIPDWIGSAASGLPSLLLFLVITLISAVYLTCDYQKIGAYLLGRLPQQRREILFQVQHKFRHTMKRYLRAYAILFSLTYGELLVGFFILRIPYAFGVAVLVSVVDILPVLGVGTVLLPWALLNFLGGDLFRGIGLLLLYVIVAVIRQVMEPKIVGGSIGLYPLLTLISMYVGLKILGLLGLILFPIALTMGKELFGVTGKDGTDHGKAVPGKIPGD